MLSVTGNGADNPYTPSNNKPYHVPTGWEAFWLNVARGQGSRPELEYDELVTAACLRGLKLTCKTWDHYGDVSGSDFIVDPSALLDDPHFGTGVSATKEDMTQRAMSACTGDSGTVCNVMVDSKWQGVSFTNEDYAYGIGEARYRVTGMVTVSINPDGSKTITGGGLKLDLYKDWNFDKGKVAEPKPLGVSLKIPLDQFADLPSMGLAHEYVLRGQSDLPL